MVIVIKTLETPKNIKAKGSSSDYIKSRVINGDNKKWIDWSVGLPRDTLQTIEMIGCIVTGFMKKRQYNARNYVAWIQGNYHGSSDYFEYHKSLLKSSYSKKYLPKKSWNQKFQTPKNPSINHVNWNPEYPRRWVGHNVPTREISAVGTNLSFVFNLNNSQNVYEQIYSLFGKHFEWTHLPGRHVLSRWQGIMGFLVFSPPRYAVPVLDTLCLSSLRCGCPRYAVLVLDTLRLS